MGLRLPVLAACAVVFLSLCIQSPSPSPGGGAPPLSPATPLPLQPVPSPSPSPAPTPTPPHPSRAPGELLALHERTVDTAVGHALREMPMRVDTLVFLRWVQDLRPRLDLEPSIRRGYGDLLLTRGNTSSGAILRVVNESLRIPDPCAFKPQYAWECPLLQALYCDVLPPPPDLLQTLLSISRRGDGILAGYAATNALQGALFLDERGCLERTETSRTVANISDRVADQARAVWEALQSPVPPESHLQSTDLFAEQVHFLLRSGNCDRVRPWWVESIAADLEGRVPYMSTVSPDYRQAPSYTVLQEALILLRYDGCFSRAAGG